MEYKRKIIVYGDYFAEFYDKQISSVKNKINYVLNLVRMEEHQKTPPKEIEKATQIMKDQRKEINYEQNQTQNKINKRLSDF